MSDYSIIGWLISLKHKSDKLEWIRKDGDKGPLNVSTLGFLSLDLNQTSWNLIIGHQNKAEAYTS